ncbi:putative quinone oxidoreductase, partial [Drosera capensis]
MELKAGLSALVTGGAAGIGKAISLAFGKRGIFVTVVDSSDDGEQVAAAVIKENARFHTDLKFPSATFIKCDVTNTGELSFAFQKHFITYGGLDICINSAGISNPLPFQEDRTDGSRSWRHTINIQTMQAAQKPGAIINLGSSAGLYPSYKDPIYSASKGGVVMFTRSLLQYKRQGIRVNVLCPEFVETALARKVDAKFIELMGGFLHMDMVIKGAFELITDENKAGSCLWITNRRGLEYWPTPDEESKYLVLRSKVRGRSSVKAHEKLKIPESFEKIVVRTLSHNFRVATMVVRVPLRLDIKPDHVLLKIVYAGVNASDVNFSSGQYFGGNENDLNGHLPFDAGFEAVGILAARGESVHDLIVGTPAAVLAFGSYTEFMMVPAKYVLPIDRPIPEAVAMLTSGLTASIALEKTARMKSGKVVLVTAAAGGTGQFAVQLAKLAGKTVVATCGGKEKAMLLKDLGVDRVINYLEEDIKSVCSFTKSN